MTSCTGTKHTACFSTAAYRVSQHVLVHPCLTHSLVTGYHLQRKADTENLAVVPFLPSILSMQVRHRVRDTERKRRRKKELKLKLDTLSTLSKRCLNLWEMEKNLTG